MLEFHHIMDKQPESDSVIVQIDPPTTFTNYYRKTEYQHCNMGMRVWSIQMPFSDYIENVKKDDWPLPNFWWCYVEDFHKEYPVFVKGRE